MAQRPLAEALNEMASADRISLPVYPAVARRVRAEAQKAASFEELKALFEPDPALVCSLFQAANSSFFKGLKQTVTLEEAMNRLGQEKTLQVLAEACRKPAKSLPDKLLPRYLPGLWRHSLGCALGCWWLANRCGYQGLATQAYLAGLLHDIGKLLLIAGLEQIAADANEEVPLSDRIIHEILDSMHPEQGRRLAENWNLPDPYVPIIADHHLTTLSGQEILPALVRLANKGCKKVGLGWEQDRTLVLPTTAEAQFLGISEIALAEFEIMLEDRFFGDEERLMLTGIPSHQGEKPPE